MQNAKLQKITNSQYHELAAVSSSGLVRLISKTPAHYRAYLKEKREPTPAMEFGTAFHSAALEPELFTNEYIVKPDGLSFATKEGKEWKLLNAQKKIISIEDHKKILGMIDSLMKLPISEAIANGECESSYLWKDEKTGILCKCRPDCIYDDLVIDIKTTEDASLKGFQQSIAKYYYYIQAAFYLEGLANCLENPPRRFIHIAVEKTAPYGIGVFELDFDALQRGKKEIRGALELLTTCEQTNIWPCYSEKIQTIALPYWAM